MLPIFDTLGQSSVGVIYGLASLFQNPQLPDSHSLSCKIHQLCGLLQSTRIYKILKSCKKVLFVNKKDPITLKQKQHKYTWLETLTESEFLIFTYTKPKKILNNL